MIKYSLVREQPTSPTNIDTGTPSACNTMKSTERITFLDPLPVRVLSQGYENDKVAARRSMSDDHIDATAAIQVLDVIARAWKLNRTEATALGVQQTANGGNTTQRTGLRLSDDQMKRICVLYYIYVTLHQLYPQEESANQWVRSVNFNPVFGGRTPMDIMVEGGLPGMLTIRDYLVGIIGK